MRCKAKFNGIDENGETVPYMMQGVGSLFELRKIPSLIKSEKDKTVFLFVGRGLNEAKLKAELLS